MGINEELKDTSSGENNFGNEGLPVGAKRFAGLRTTQVLKQMWRNQISFYNETKILLNAGLTKDGKSLVGLEEFMIEVSDTNSEVFKGKLHPEVYQNPIGLQL